MKYFDLLQQGAFADLFRLTLPKVNSDPLAAEAFLRVFLPKNNLFLLDEEAVELLKKEVHDNNPFAQYGLARWLGIVQPDEQAVPLSLNLFTKAYNAGIADAGAAISMAWSYGDFGQVDRSKALQFRNEAVQHNSLLGCWYELRGQIFGNWFTEMNPEQALKHIDDLIRKDMENNLPPNGAWFMLRAEALEKADSALAAIPDLEKACELGIISAYFWLAYARGYGDSDELINSDAYFDTIAEGIQHLDDSSMYAAAWDSFGDEEDLPTDPDERQEAVEELMEDLEDAAKLGNTLALLDLAEIWHDGKYGHQINKDKAWSYLTQAARYEDQDAFERLWAMIEDGEVNKDRETKDIIALKGARCGSEMLIQEVVKAYKAGRLQAFSNEITDYYLPQYPNIRPDEPAQQTEPEEENTSISTDERPALKATDKALKQYYKDCIDCCKNAEHILQEMDDPSPIADMARQVVIYGRWLGQFEHMLSKAYEVTHRMAKCIYEHPRLLLELKQVEYDILTYIQAVEDHNLEIAEDLRDEIDELKDNIKAADEGRWSDIKNDRMLKSDPVEWTAEYEAVIDDADHEAYQNLKDSPRGMGFCFGYWAAKRAALAKRGIEWRDPHTMNPRVMFD